MAIGSILRLMSQMLGLNRGRVLQPVPPHEDICIHYSYGLTAGERARGVYRYGEGITGKVMTTGREVVVQNVDEDPDILFRAVDRQTLPQEVVSFLAVPILDDNIPIGVLGAHRLRMRPRSFDADLTVMRIIATFVAQILQINQLFDERTQRLREENLELKGALQSRQVDHGILGKSPAVRAALSQVMQVADTPVTVLLTGESGTGKEKFSQVLHLNSRRKDKPFLAINCAAIPEQLLESELFGHERGAFTGATSTKQGKVELADGGTLFLDEIGDLNLELQSKLLRILENQVVQRVGGTKNIPVDVRIVTAALDRRLDDKGYIVVDDAPRTARVGQGLAFVLEDRGVHADPLDIKHLAPDVGQSGFDPGSWLDMIAGVRLVVARRDAKAVDLVVDQQLRDVAGADLVQHPPRVQHLRHDLARSQMPPESSLPRRAKNATHRTTRLSADTYGVPSRVAHQDRFNGLAIAQTQEKLPRETVLAADFLHQSGLIEEKSLGLADGSIHPAPQRREKIPRIQIRVDLAIERPPQRPGMTGIDSVRRENPAEPGEIVIVQRSLKRN